ncbi:MULTISPECIES: saccharopine dehydrogenase NADP-binding domain-containing protein [Enterobacterales]|uniref:saccharopine dehydrogenase NADP-binding domain-containing protein n=1 Tax=Enterobacterales TaxID=91347 RepID=UPI002ED80BAE
MTMQRIAILGASGGIGHFVTQWLAELGYPLRLGARQPLSLRSLALRYAAQWQTVDLWHDDALRRFCAECSLVINCAGPSYQVLDRVANAAAEAGADYIDVSGDGPAWQLLRQRTPVAGWRAVLSAGMLPGLANLVPRGLSDRLGGSLTVWCGGIERIGGAAAADLVLSLNEQHNALAPSDYWYGEAGASWRLGRRCRHSLTAQRQDSLPHFPGQVTLLPYLSADVERLALDRQLANVQWYNVFCGNRLHDTLTGLRGALDGTSASLSKAIHAVEAASAIDLLGFRPWYHMVFDLQQEGCATTRAVVATESSQALSAAVAVSCARRVLQGEIAPGIHFADSVLPAKETLEEVCRLHRGTSIQQYQPDLQHEEGAL